MEKTPTRINWLPIRKVAVGFVAAALVWIAQRIGLDIGSAALNQAATAVVGFVVAYLVPQAAQVPAVREAVEAVEDVLDAVDKLKTVELIPVDDASDLPPDHPNKPKPEDQPIISPPPVVPPAA